MRENGILNYGFTAAFDGKRLLNITKLDDKRYDYISGYKSLELMGFTSKAKKWSSLSYNNYDLEKLEHVKLSDLVCAK